MNLVFIIILLLFIVLTPLALIIKNYIEGETTIEKTNNESVIEGYTDGFNYCKESDQDYNIRTSCYDISYNDISGNKQGGKSRIYGSYYISYDGYLKKVPDKTLYTPADNKIGYSPKGTNGITICEKDDPKYNNTSICKIVNYYDNNNTKTTERVKLSNRVYLDASGFVKQVPYGYIANEQQNGYIPNTDSEEYASATDPSRNNPYIRSTSEYDANNLNVNYRESSTSNNANNQEGPGKMWIIDGSGKLISIPYKDVSNSTLYYEPGSYRYGPSKYVPNYEESIYLSTLTKKSTTTPILDAPYLKAGFCEENKSFPFKLEEKCNKLNRETCASTKCCVLLGGQKCVSGNENGPKFSHNYSNLNIKNRDFYYYQGKCYGNCP